MGLSFDHTQQPLGISIIITSKGKAYEIPKAFTLITINGLKKIFGFGGL